jgi:hypothetical protein
VRRLRDRLPLLKAPNLYFRVGASKAEVAVELDYYARDDLGYTTGNNYLRDYYLREDVIEVRCVACVCSTKSLGVQHHRSLTVTAPYTPKSLWAACDEIDHTDVAPPWQWYNKAVSDPLVVARPVAKDVRARALQSPAALSLVLTNSPEVR